jgi:GNAT superfamily N-acetyltransferase
LTPFSDEPLDTYLEEHGYQHVEPTDVLSMPLGAPSKYSALGGLQEVDLDVWVQEYAALSGRPSSTIPLLRSILQACGQPCFRGAVSAGEPIKPVAFGLAVLDQDLVGLFDLVTAEQHRRRGYGAALVAGLLGWGVARGAHRAYLQVVRTNVPARELYRKLGFTLVYTYWYRVRQS